MHGAAAAATAAAAMAAAAAVAAAAMTAARAAGRPSLAGKGPGVAAPPPTRVALLSLSGLALKERRPPRLPRPPNGGAPDLRGARRAGPPVPAQCPSVSCSIVRKYRLRRLAAAAAAFTEAPTS